MTYLLTAIGLPPGGSSTVHIYTQRIHRTTQNNTTKYTEQHNKIHRTTQQYIEQHTNNNNNNNNNNKDFRHSVTDFSLHILFSLHIHSSPFAASAHTV